MTLLLHIFEPYYQTRPYKPISGPYKFEIGALENHMLGGKYVNVHAPLEYYVNNDLIFKKSRCTKDSLITDSRTENM